MEFFYGISRLVNPELIKDNTIIYAPNGVMKTSFSDGLSDLSKNRKPTDVFNSKASSYEIEFDGKVITSESVDTSIPVIVYSENIINDEVFTNQDISRFVMSKELRDEYLKQLKRSDELKQKVFKAVAEKVTFDKKSTTKAEQLIKETFGGDSTIETLKNIVLKEIKMSDEILNVSLLDVFNSNTDKILYSKEFVDQANCYKDIVSKKLNEKIFNNGFSINDLQSVFDNCKTSNYFKAGHSLYIDNEIYYEQQMSDYLKQLVLDVYQSDETKKVFDDTKKLLEKNKDTRKLADTILKVPEILIELNDPQQFKKNFIIAKIKAELSDFEADKIALVDIEENIRQIFKKSKEHQQVWRSVLEEYNSRFLNNVFEIVIANEEKAVLDIETPQFQKVLKDSKVHIDESIKKRLSSGERRAILILNLIFEVELLKSKNEPFLLVLDDIVESFDYKNKYAMLEYLKVASCSDKMQLIILTHNFDFYRSCRLVLSRNLESKLMAYNSQGIVTLYNANQKHYEDFSYFKDWKNDGRITSYLALIPFMRNIEELENGSKNNVIYNRLTVFLHYNSQTRYANLKDIKDIFTRFNFKDSADYDSKSYLTHLYESAKKLVESSSVKETCLQSKIIVGLFLRVFCDKFMWEKYIEINGTDPKLPCDHNESRHLYDLIQKDLSKDEKLLIMSIFTIAPSLIHVNSFMYEPLVDIGSEKLIDTANKLLGICKA